MKECSNVELGILAQLILLSYPCLACAFLCETCRNSLSQHSFCNATHVQVNIVLIMRKANGCFIPVDVYFINLGLSSQHVSPTAVERPEANLSTNSWKNQTY
jgi:hypothetical protein